MALLTRKRLVMAGITAAAVAAVGAATLLVVVYSGVIDVAADEPHDAFTHWILTTTQKHSVRASAKDIRPPNLQDARLITAGAIGYDQMCGGCHGAPGVEPNVVGQGLNPAPPNLQKGPELTGAQAAAAFWVVKHGIRMTGMPAFGKTHSDEQLWEIIAFVERSRTMTSREYNALVAKELEQQTATTSPAPDTALAPSAESAPSLAPEATAAAQQKAAPDGQQKEAVSAPRLPPNGSVSAPQPSKPAPSAISPAPVPRATAAPAPKPSTPARAPDGHDHRH